jgi:hypothetical protein
LGLIKTSNMSKIKIIAPPVAIKLKSYKLDRDNKKLIIQQIEWLKNETGDEYDCDFIKSLIPLNKKQLIEVWTELVVRLNYPQLDWLLIYY